MNEFEKEYEKLKYDADIIFLNSLKKRVKWEYLMISLHTLLVLLYTYPFGWRNVVAIVWLACVALDVNTLLKNKKKIIEYEETSMESLKKFNEIEWKKQIRTKKLKRVL